MTWALRSLYRPSARAHLPTTCQGAMVVLPDGSRAPSGGGSAGVSSPADIYQQTLTAACASGGAAPMHWGAWGPSATNKRRRVYTGALLATTTTINAYKRGLKVVCSRGILYSKNRHLKGEDLCLILV